MCGCYYVDDETGKEIEELIKQADGKIRKAENIHLQAGDIHPLEIAPVIAAKRNVTIGIYSSVESISADYFFALSRKYYQKQK